MDAENPAPEEELTPEQQRSIAELLAKIEPLHEAALDSEARNQRVYDDTEAALGRIVRKHFPRLGNWDPDLLRKLADVIARAAWSYFEQLDRLDFEQGRRDQGEPPRADRGLP